MTLVELTADFQRRVIALKTHAGSHRKAAAELGISTARLSKIKRRLKMPLVWKANRKEA